MPSAYQVTFFSFCAGLLFLFSSFAVPFFQPFLSGVGRGGTDTVSILQELVDIKDLLQGHYRDMQDMEFTIEEKKVYMLQTRLPLPPLSLSLSYLLFMPIVFSFLLPPSSQFSVSLAQEWQAHVLRCGEDCRGHGEGGTP